MGTIYNSKYTFINSTEQKLQLPSNFIEYKLNEYTLSAIKSEEIQTHKLFNGHVVYRESTQVNFDKIIRLDLTDNKVYSKKIKHSGNVNECFINLNFIICNSWMLPFVLDANCDYAYLRKHRAKLYNYLNKELL